MNRPTQATGALEEASLTTLLDSNGHPDFVLIGSDFVPSQKAQEEMTPPKPRVALVNRASLEPDIHDEKDDVASLEDIDKG